MVPDPNIEPSCHGASTLTPSWCYCHGKTDRCATATECCTTTKL